MRTASRLLERNQSSDRIFKLNASISLRNLTCMCVLVVVQDELRSERLPAPDMLAMVLLDLQMNHFVVVVITAGSREGLVANAAGFVVAVLHDVVDGERLFAFVGLRAEFAVQSAVAVLVIERLETSLVAVRLFDARRSRTSRSVTPQLGLGSEAEVTDIACDWRNHSVISVEMNVQGVSFRVEQPRAGFVRARELFICDAQMNSCDVADDVCFVFRLEATFITK